MTAHIITPSVSPTGTGVTLRRYWQLLADALGFWHQTVVTEQAITGEDTRYVLSDELRDDEAGQQHPAARYLYARPASGIGEQRRIISQPEVGWQGPEGAVLLSRPLSAPLDVGAVVDITSPRPVRRHLATQGLVDSVNEALAHCWIRVGIPLVGNGTDRYELTPSGVFPYGAPQLAGVSETGATVARADRVPVAVPATIVLDGASRLLVSPRTFSVGTPFWVEAIMRADSYVNSGAGWVITDGSGLDGDEDQAAAPERWVTTIGMAKALASLMTEAEADLRMADEQRQRVLGGLERRRRGWAAAAAQIVRVEMPKALPAHIRPVTWVEASSAW